MTGGDLTAFQGELSLKTWLPLKTSWLPLKSSWLLTTSCLRRPDYFWIPPDYDSQSDYQLQAVYNHPDPLWPLLVWLQRQAVYKRADYLCDLLSTTVHLSTYWSQAVCRIFDYLWGQSLKASSLQTCWSAHLTWLSSTVYTTISCWRRSPESRQGAVRSCSGAWHFCSCSALLLTIRACLLVSAWYAVSAPWLTATCKDARIWRDSSTCARALCILSPLHRGWQQQSACWWWDGRGHITCSHNLQRVPFKQSKHVQVWRHKTEAMVLVLQRESFPDLHSYPDTRVAT